MESRDRRGANLGCRFSIFVPYLTLPGGNQQICGASARVRIIDGREVDLCDVHHVEAQRALASGSSGVLIFADGPDSRRIVVVQRRPTAQ